MLEGLSISREAFARANNLDYPLLSDSDGTVARTVMLPVSRPTSCTFGGKDLRTLYITTASFRLKDLEKAAQPHAGGLLAVDVGVAGVEEPMFGG